MTFYRMNKTPKTSNERDALVTPAKSPLVNRNILIDEELVKFLTVILQHMYICLLYTSDAADE